MVSASDVGRLFLQAVISRRVVSDRLARVLWGKCIEAVKAADDDVEIPYDPNRFDEFVNGLNNRLSPIDLKLSVTIDEVTAKKIWAVVNLKGDELAQVATDHTPVEIAYFKAVVEQIVLAPSESYSITEMAALREVNDLKPTMSKGQAEVVLANFTAKGWLLKSERRRYSLSSRALLELQTYLKTNYEDDIHECTVCFDLVTKGVGCYTPACGARLHNHCYKRFSRDSNACPSCQTSWSQAQKLTRIGEGAVRDGDDGRRRTKKKDPEEDEEENDSEEEEPEPKSKPAKKRNVRGAKSKQRYVQEEAEDDDASEDHEMDFDEDGSPAPLKSQGRRKR